jgi:starvation-inducible DNA-binding protein
MGECKEEIREAEDERYSFINDKQYQLEGTVKKKLRANLINKNWSVGILSLTKTSPSKRKGTDMATTKNIDALNQLLADLTVDYHKLQNAHWYITGKDFFQVHATLEELYDGVLPHIDEVAELILQEGGRPVASLKETLALSKVEERPSEPLSSEEAFSIVKADFELLQSDAATVKSLADESGRTVVSAAMDDILAELSKNLWMLRQQAQEI